MNNPVKLAELSKDWLNLSNPYRPSAFWFWNSDMDRDRMREVIEEMKRNDIREFLIHPVHGMEVEYLSDEFFDCYRHALSLAKAHDMKVWVYDEYSWPSGTAGGIFLREHPEHRGWCLSFSKDDSGNVSANPMESDRVLDSSVGAPWTRNETGYIDTLSHEAMQCFIKMTHERYYQECKDFFGNTIVGFFTDEPAAMVDGRTGKSIWQAACLPWTPSFPERFKDKFGYDIESKYTELTGEGLNHVKQDYWVLVKEMHSQAYHAQIGKWCRGHGVKYTGHLGEDVPLQQVRFAGSVFECLKHMDEPGVDMLLCQPEPEDRFAEQVLISSIARHCGKDRVYCEAFGISSFDIRLGQMLRCAQMLGAHGVNDVALMGFQQSLDGVRKRTYWPPIFDQAPWWPFYSEFRDAFARSVALTSLGKRQARYAILYPQNQLEQTDLFNTDIGSWADAASRMINELGMAVYESGEIFEFVFPEILDQSYVSNGKIVFPNAEYDAILAPCDINFFDESIRILSDLKRDGGKVFQETTEYVANTISSINPCWSEQLTIDGNWPGNIRLYRFDYPDGQLIALRNISGVTQSIKVSSNQFLCELNPVNGTVATVPKGEAECRIEAHSMLYFAVSKSIIGEHESISDYFQIPIDTQWNLSTQTPNTAKLTNIRFLSGDKWVDAKDAPIHAGDTNRQETGIPLEFRGETSIQMSGEFICDSLPASLSIMFEEKHLSTLSINGNEVDISSAKSLPVWDQSCMAVDIRQWVSVGKNEVSAVLQFKEFETSILNDGFLDNWCMPSCDVFLGGSFRLLNGVMVSDNGSPLDLPIDISAHGWKEYCGILSLTGSIEIDSAIDESIVGMEVDLIAEDGLEVLIDGNSIGKRITAPYRFELGEMDAGQHTITLHISGTSGNLLASPANWGVNSVKLLCSHR